MVYLVQKVDHSYPESSSLISIKTSSTPALSTTIYADDEKTTSKFRKDFK